MNENICNQLSYQAIYCLKFLSRLSSISLENYDMDLVDGWQGNEEEKKKVLTYLKGWVAIAGIGFP